MLISIDYLMLLGKWKEPFLSLLQFVGRGFEGDHLLTLMQQQMISSSSDLEIRCDGRCRTCTTLLDEATGDATEIIEPSEPVSAANVDSMLKMLQEKYSTRKAKSVAAMGSMPPGCPPDLYAKIISSTCDEGSKVLLDTAAGLPATLQTCETVGCAVMLKVNARELCTIAGVDIKDIVSQSESTAAIPLSTLETAAVRMFSSYEALAFLAITDGKFPATFFTKSGQISRIEIPPLPRPVISPIGAGKLIL